MKRNICLLLLLISTCCISAQNLKGHITDTKGEPIYGSTIYIKEANQGLICNESGYYQTTLAPNTYFVEYKCLGFKGKSLYIRISPDSTTIKNITLEESPFELSEITFSNTEDPAYNIMRKAITKAPAYAKATNSYTAEAYVKGNMELHSVSKLMDKMMQKEEGIRASELKDQTFTQETFNEIRFTAPDRYEQTVKAFSSSFPDNFDSKEAFKIMKGSLYLPKYGTFISPLNEKAFSYYRFRYEGFSEENGMAINKISIQPKVNDPILVSGHIYIVDGTWHIHSAELTNRVMGIVDDYTISYQEIDRNIFLPITYKMVSRVDMLGIKATTNYYASLKYSDLVPNEQMAENETKMPKPKRNFKIESDSLYTTIADTLARKRDSTYWAARRTVPLKEKEAIGFAQRDSIQKYIDSVRQDIKSPKFTLDKFVFGGQTGVDSSRVRLKYNGIYLIVPDYNLVDGFSIGPSAKITYQINDKNRLEIRPYIYYVTARERILAGSDVDWEYAPLRFGKLSISGGSTSADFNPIGTTRFDNTFETLLYGTNKSSFYQKDFASISNTIEVANGISIETGIEVAKRRGLSNNTDYTILGARRKMSPNTHTEDVFDNTSYSIGVEYTPYAYYSIRKGVKRYEKYLSPTFRVDYTEAFSSWQKNNSKYRKLSGTIKQTIRTSYFDRLEYFVNAGTFLGSRQQMHFADYQHFDATKMMTTVKIPFDSYLLSNSYDHSTNRHWVNARINYTSQYILLKRIPFLQGKPFTESLHIKSLYTPDSKFYSEVGYSINLTRYLCAGVYSSFNNLRYDDWGFRLSYDLITIKSLID